MENPLDDRREPMDEMADTMAPPTARTLPPLPPPSPVLPMLEPRPPQVKAPLLAVFLSVFPGLGQLYNEQPAKAVFVWFYNLIDAWTSANDINQRALSGEVVRKETSFESPLWGGTLLGMGLLLLLNNLGWLRLAALGRYWPIVIVLVVIGAVFLARAVRARQAPAPREPFDDRPL
jgi:hypothetical protein